MPSPVAATPARPSAPPATANALILALALLWGLNWPATRLALDEVSPLPARAIGLSLGAAALVAMALVRGRRLALPGWRAKLHIAVAGALNVGAFALFTTFAILGAATSRVAIIAYTMPLWAAAMAWAFLGERLDRLRATALGLGAVGLGILLLPFVGSGFPPALLIALGAAIAWAGGTVYLKWARVQADPMAIAAWQLVAGAVMPVIGLLLFEPHAHLWPLRGVTMAALAYNGLMGTAAAYAVWFAIVRRLPVATAALGSLLAPVVGVIGSTVLVGDRPTATDLAGFALVLAAAACVLLPKRRTG